ncbi:CGNR zinc finger domain-containing protein [Actinomycetospora termitidis]|uniref:CGNR zinc finger domain-containing protein n=1 Tax=Actinomycetospora termitidis TaxID=3053470 RepID=A0ABT7M795_9PSEU|nr:CGNR zinc finger domain-containing protein [Actinomycetospora sp. Odt1-22]MDL5156548.1 CGNR zinc finger domain-containing protein [Actinomycetospora sp. Odt1-22]
MFVPDPAPAPLHRAQSLVNTWYGRLTGGGEERLATPADLARWASACGDPLAPDEVTDDDVALALVVREGVRAVLAPRTDSGRPEDPAALAALDGVADRLPLHFTTTGPALAPGVGTARGALAAALAGLVTADPRQRERLKVCRDGRCRTSFYDTSRNGSGVWCSMAECGAANKQAAFVQRRRARRADGAGQTPA